METLDTETDITLEHATLAEKQIQEKLNRYYQNQDEIELRLLELDNEWDIEQLLQAKGAAITILGGILGLTVNKKWMLLPIATSLILVAFSVSGLPEKVQLLQKFGFRTRNEIDKEKYALKAIRGDFKYLLDVPNSVWNAVNK